MRRGRSHRIWWIFWFATITLMATLTFFDQLNRLAFDLGIGRPAVVGDVVVTMRDGWYRDVKLELSELLIHRVDGAPPSILMSFLTGLKEARHLQVFRLDSVSDTKVDAIFGDVEEFPWGFGRRGTIGTDFYVFVPEHTVMLVSNEPGLFSEVVEIAKLDDPPR